MNVLKTKQQIVVQENPIEQESVIIKTKNDWEYVAPKKETETNLNFDFVPLREKKKIKRWVYWVVGAAIVLTGGTLLLLKNKNKSNGDPGGAPITPDVEEVDLGGPGGAPPTTGK